MSAHYRARIPFGVPHLISGATVPRAIQLRRDRAGRVLLPVISPAGEVLGRTITATASSDGLHVVCDLGASAARQWDFHAGGYFLDAMLSRGLLAALQCSAIASWDCAELQPATTSPASSSPRASVDDVLAQEHHPRSAEDHSGQKHLRPGPVPIPPRPAVNLQPIARPR